jgi:hypothetical protein
MKRILGSLFVLLIFSIAENSHGDFTGKGHVHTLGETQRVFLNPDCGATDTCDLKRFALTERVYEVWFSDDPKHPTYGNGVIIEYETASVDDLEKYAIVQFKKGCVFHTSKTRQGKLERKVNDNVMSFGEDIPFCFSDWVIDSQDSDPAYNSDPEHGRFHLLRWNQPGSYDERTQKFYGTERPETPIVYMADYPAGAFVTGTGVRNVALEFNTCIFKASDVPRDTRRENVKFARAITCFEWQNIYVYDFASGRFRTELAPLPGWKAPAGRVRLHLLLLFTALLVALALVASIRSARLAR